MMAARSRQGTENKYFPPLFLLLRLSAGSDFNIVQENAALWSVMERLQLEEEH